MSPLFLFVSDLCFAHSFFAAPGFAFPPATSIETTINLTRGSGGTSAATLWALSASLTSTYCSKTCASKSCLAILASLLLVGYCCFGSFLAPDCSLACHL